MTTRKQIIAQLDDEIARLEKVRDLLMASLKDARKVSKAFLPLTLKAKAPEKKRKQPVKAAPRVAVKAAPIAVAPPPPPPSPVNPEPEIKRLPPKRRMERRHAHDKHGKSGAALSGSVPQGPVAVSATEARKVQERVVAAPPTPAVTELRPENPGERSLGSLIQAFERRAGLSGLETS
jgi:hypothetical protein